MVMPRRGGGSSGGGRGLRMMMCITRVGWPSEEVGEGSRRKL